MMRRGFAFLISSILLIGCASSNPPGNADQDVTQWDAPDYMVDSTEVAEGTDMTHNHPVTMDFAFATPKGPKGRYKDKVVLTANDEPDAYKDRTGFQTDIMVTTTGLEPGHKIYLVIAGNEYPYTATLKQDLTAEFQEVTLSSSKAGYDIRVEARDAKGVIAFATKHVILDLGTCEVQVQPKGKCIVTDGDPDTPGVQGTFIVYNPDKTCDKATLTVGWQNGKPVTQTKNIVDGKAQFLITVAQLDKVNDFPISVKAEVTDSTDPSRDSAPLTLGYVVDNQAPIIKITKPAKDNLTLKDDEDQDPSNGLNITLAGTVQGSDGQPVALKLNGKDYVTSVIDNNNNFSTKFDFVNDGAYSIQAIAQDSCGNEGTAEKDISVHITKSNYVIKWPQQGEVLLAKDDADLQTPMVYDTNFKVAFDTITPPVTIQVYCQNATNPLPPAMVGQKSITSVMTGDITIPVTLDTVGLGTDVKCYVMDNAANPGSSSPVRFTIGLPGPKLRILDPANKSFVTAHTLHLVLQSSFVQGKTPHITIKDHDSGITVLDMDAPAKLGLEGATYDIPLKSSGGDLLPDGTYDLSVDVQDKFGNKASENPDGLTNVTFTLDTTAPAVEITAPAQDIDPAVSPDTDPGTPGFQATVHVNVVSGGDDGTRVCLTINGDSQVCKDATNNAVDFTSVTLIPGINELRAWATDAAGNVGTQAVLGVTLHLDVPRVTIVDPPADGPVAKVPFQIKVLVQDQGRNPLSGLKVSLLKNGTVFKKDVLSGPDGFVTFDIDNLSPTGDTFVAMATQGGKTGASSPRRLYLKQGMPQISFVALKDNGYINLASTVCQAGAGDCHAVIQVATQNVEDGSSATLTWNCGGGDKQAQCTVANNACSFTGIVLPNNTMCQFTAKVSDSLGQTAQAGPIHVSVDRTPPVIRGFKQPSSTYLLGDTSDADPNTPGFQYPVVVLLGGVEAGQQAVLNVGLVGGAAQQYTADIQTDIDQHHPAAVNFGNVTMPEGSVALKCIVRDKAGNQAELTKVVSVQIHAPLVRIVSSQFKICHSNDQCTTGVCLERGQNSSCTIAWGLKSNTSVIIQYSNVAAAPNNVRVCTDAPGAQGDECQASGFHAIYYATIPSAGTTATLYPAIDNLPQGDQALEVEVLGTNGDWVDSYEETSTQPNTRWLPVTVDTQAPVVNTFECTSDTLDPKGTLNKDELDADGKYEFHVQASEGGTLNIYSGAGQVVASDPAFSGDGTYKIDLSDGKYTLYAIVTDKAGNTSPGLNDNPPAPSVALTVDKTPPDLIFVYPTAQYIKHGDSKQVTVQAVHSDDVIGQDATLKVVTEDGTTHQETGQIDQDGMLTFAYLLPEGHNNISVETTDPAGNTTTINTDVIVDTTLPSVNIEQPAQDPVNLKDADDADNTKPGFQFTTQFSTSDDAVTYSISIAIGCDANWSNCTDVRELVPSTPLAHPGDVEDPVTVTLPNGEYMKLIVNVKDAAGNEASTEKDIHLQLTSCYINFVDTGFIGNVDCNPNPGQDCDSTTHTFQIYVSPACGQPDSVSLTKGDGQNYYATDLGSSYIQIKDVPVSHNETFDAHATVVFGGTQKTADLHVTVDLHDPKVTVQIEGVQPQANGQYLLGTAQDLLPGQAGLQSNLLVQITDDNRADGYINRLDRTVDGNTTPVSPQAPTLPLKLNGDNSATIKLTYVTLLDQKHNTLTLHVVDAAGNDTDVSIEGDVDLIPPSAVAIGTVQAINVRQPKAELTWSAVDSNQDDPSGVGATRYEVRYSRQPITSDTDFDNACTLDTLLKTNALPGGEDPGQAITFDVTGPDTRVFNDPCSFAPQTDPAKCTYYFAVRAVDAVGNKGPVQASKAVDLCMHHVKISAGADFQDKSTLWQRAWPIGDVNGDGLADVAVGGYASDMICVVYGTKTPTDVTLTNNGGANYQCFKGTDITSGEGGFGSPVVGGDIDGDGVNDLAVASGAGSSNPHKVYIFFGVKNGQINSTPNVVISGFNYGSYGTQMTLNGDFNGDGYKDLLIASKRENKAYLVPGAPQWKDATNLDIDLSNPTDLNTNKVTVFQLTDTVSGTYYFFGMFVGYLKDIDGDGKDEAVIGQYRNPGCYYLFKGRSTNATQVLSVSTKWDGSGDQPNVVRARVDTGMADKVTWDNDGQWDLGWGDKPDFMFTDYYQTGNPLKHIFIFSGDFLAGQFGSDARIDPQNTDEIVPGVFTNNNGTVIVGHISNVSISGPFDGLTRSGILFTNDNTLGADGYVYFRSNYAKQGAFAEGTFPVTNMAFRNPYDPTNPDFGWGSGSTSHVKAIGDFNNDGFYDIIVGRDQGNYQVILY